MLQTSHTTIAELSAEEARKTVHEDVLSFVTTAELVPLSSALGQARVTGIIPLLLSTRVWRCSPA